MKHLLIAAALMFAAPAAMAAACPVGSSFNSFPACVKGAAAVDLVDGNTGCYFVTVDGNEFVVVPDSALVTSVGAEDAGAAALKAGLEATKGQMRVFIGAGRMTTVCVKAGMPTERLGEIQ